MKKIFCTIIVLFSVVAVSHAQVQSGVRSSKGSSGLEFEGAIGLQQGGKYNGAKAELGLQLLIELRSNIKGSPFDVGAQLSISALNRYHTPTYPLDHTIRYSNIITYFDYNYRKWRSVSLFGGLGVGYSSINNEYDSIIAGAQDGTIFDRSAVFNPRIGVELFKHARLTLDHKFMNRGYSYTSLSVGFVLSGGRN